MRSRSTVIIFGIAIAIQITIVGPAVADAFADCVRKAASKAVTAKTAFQRDMRDLIVERRPEFMSVANVNMELQIRFAKRRRAMFEYLLEHDASRIDTANGLGQFSNFGWSDEDTQRFVERSESNRALETQISTLQVKNNKHPDWPKMREYFRSELSQSSSFKALMDRFSSQQGDIEAIISGCHRR